VTTRITDLYRESNYFKKDRHGQFGKIPADDQVSGVLVQFMYFFDFGLTANITYPNLQ